MKLDKIATIFGIILPLWGGAVFLFNYEKSIAKKSDLAIMDLDARIERTEIIVAIYSRDPQVLTELEKNEYDRAKNRLLSLEGQRDKLLGVNE